MPSSWTFCSDRRLTDTDGVDGDTEAERGSDHSTLIETANLITGAAGADSTTESGSTTTTATDSGTDARGSFTATTTATQSVSENDNANDVTGSDLLSTTTTDVSNGTRAGGNGTTSYSQALSDSATSTDTDNSNDITGSDTPTTTNTDHANITETGSYGSETYALSEFDSSSSTVTGTDNLITGSYTTTTTEGSGSSISENGGIGVSDIYALTKTVGESDTQVSTGDDIAGSYSTSTTATDTTTNEESTANTTAGTTYTETESDTPTTQETGNSITGDYTRSTADTTTTTDTDVYGPAATPSDHVSVTEASTQTATGTQTGNYVSGDYTLSQTASDTYTMTETSTTPGGGGIGIGGGGGGGGPSPPGAFVLTEHGSLSSTTTETGNTVAGNYTRTETAADTFSMSETGTNIGGGFSETLTGTDAPTLTEIGNSVNQTYDRTIVGTGTYTLTDSGAGATLSSGSGSLGYTLVETSDARAGMLSQSETGTDRYSSSILERYVNVANTGSNQPGNMDYYPFGRPFVDPLALPSDTRGTWVEGTRGNGLFEYSDTPLNRERGLVGLRVRFANNCIAPGAFPSQYYYGGSAEAARVQIAQVRGTDADMRAADVAYRIRHQNPNWTRPVGYTWNHVGEPGSTTMELMDSGIHRAVHHQGNASVARAAGRVAGNTTVRAVAFANVYLTLRAACQAAGIGYPDYETYDAPYYFTASDGSVFIVRVPGSLNFWDNPSRRFIAGPRAGEEETITSAEVAAYRVEGERRYGRFVPGGIFFPSRFFPGTERRRLPIFDSQWSEIGYIDADGEHFYPQSRIQPGRA